MSFDTLPAFHPTEDEDDVVTSALKEAAEEQENADPCVWASPASDSSVQR